MNDNNISFSRTPIISNNEKSTNDTKIECKICLIKEFLIFFFFSVIEPKIENLLTINTMIVEQRRAAKTKQKCKFYRMIRKFICFSCDL